MYTINYTPRRTREEHNGPLMWIAADKDESTPSFVGEISELRDISDLGRARLGIDSVVTVKNTANGNRIVFKCMKVNTDGEDVYGWHFKAISGNKFPVTMLIIND